MSRLFHYGGSWACLARLGRLWEGLHQISGLRGAGNGKSPSSFIDGSEIYVNMVISNSQVRLPKRWFEAQGKKQQRFRLLCCSTTTRVSASESYVRCCRGTIFIQAGKCPNIFATHTSSWLQTQLQNTSNQ